MLVLISSSLFVFHRQAMERYLKKISRLFGKLSLRQISEIKLHQLCPLDISSLIVSNRNWLQAESSLSPIKMVIQIIIYCQTVCLFIVI